MTRLWIPNSCNMSRWCSKANVSTPKINFERHQLFYIDVMMHDWSEEVLLLTPMTTLMYREGCYGGPVLGAGEGGYLDWGLSQPNGPYPNQTGLIPTSPPTNLSFQRKSLINMTKTFWNLLFVCKSADGNSVWSGWDKAHFLSKQHVANVCFNTENHVFFVSGLSDEMVICRATYDKTLIVDDLFIWKPHTSCRKTHRAPKHWTGCLCVRVNKSGTRKQILPEPI